jgi:integration host factor subunit alpha
MALTKEKLIIQLQTHLGMTKRESQQTVERLFKIMKSTLSQGEDLLISVLRKKARQGRNPQTKDSLTIGARKVVVFKTSKVLRRRLNSPEMIIHFD